MRAFHSDPEVKAKYLKRVEEHFLADEIVQGYYWEEGKGCAVGCTIHSEEHISYETELGIPELLANLEDHIFEGLPNELAKTWPGRFLKAIKTGADLSKIWSKFAIFLLTDESQCDSKHPQCVVVARAFQDELNGTAVNWGEIRIATANAATAAGYVATAAGYAANAAASAADATLHVTAVNAYYAAANATAAGYAANAAAANTVTAAAYHAADAAAYTNNASNTKAYIAQSEKLLELLKEARPDGENEVPMDEFQKLALESIAEHQFEHDLLRDK